MGERRARARTGSRHSQSRAGSTPLVHLAGLAAGVVLTVLAWFYLVGAAIDFGVVAVRGKSSAWLFSLSAGLGAVVCLVLALALVGRGLRSLGFISDYKPRRAAARRRR